MPERSRRAQPGMVPASHSEAGTMFAALYGELVPHPWHDPEHDAYALFHKRSEAMGWLDDRPTQVPGSAPGLWVMNDAGWVIPSLSKPDWSPGFRWASMRSLSTGRCRCNRSCGALRFADYAPQARTAVQVSVNSGRDPSIPVAVAQFTDHLGRLEQDVFVYRSHTVASHDDVPPPPFDDSFWNGPPAQGVTLHGELVEWSTDAIGWLAEVVADGAARLGVRTPLLFTVTRTTSMS